MAHLILIYNIFILLILFITFNIPVFIFCKTKDKFLGHYILFFLPFILYTLSLMIFTYLETNMNIKNLELFRYLDYSSEFFFIFMMFSIGFYTNYLYSVNNAFVKNLILSLVSLFLIIIIPFAFKARVEGDILYIKDSYLENISTFVFIIIIIYFVIVGFRNYKKIKNVEIRNIAKASIFITLFSSPGLLRDFYGKISQYNPIEHIVHFGDDPAFLIHPIFYSVLSIACTYYIVKYYFKEYQITVSEIPLNNFIKEYNISNREKEVVQLLLNGRSNKEIADSLFISVNTVKTHIKNIYEKIGIKSRYELLTVVKNI